MSDDFRSRSVVVDLLDRLLDAVVAHYTDVGADLPERRLISAGPPAWDCESVAVWGERTAGHDGDINHETPTSLTGFHGSMLRALTAGVTITRCTVDVPDINPLSGRPEWPSAADVTAEASVVYQDEPLVTEAIRLGAAAGLLPNLNDWSLLDWKVVGPLGGFVASELKVRLSTDWCPPPPGS